MSQGVCVMLHLWGVKQCITPGIECFKLSHKGRSIHWHHCAVLIEAAKQRTLIASPAERCAVSSLT